jgi:hypothetical protein
MGCGWGCGAELTVINMRAHFTICEKRPAASEHGDCRGRHSTATRGRPTGRRRLCGWLRLPTHGGPDARALHYMSEAAPRLL